MFHIPLVIYSKLLKEDYAGEKNPKYASQVDIAATLFSQLNFSYSDFKWSKNILNRKQNGFAYYGFVDGFGWLTDYTKLVYDNRAEKIIYSSENNSKIDQSLKTGQAYLQSLYQQWCKKYRTCTRHHAPCHDNKATILCHLISQFFPRDQ